AGAEAPPAGSPAAGPRPLLVERFVEKPDAATAARYLAEGGYLWNAGMLVAGASRVLEELERAGEAAATPSSAHSARIASVAREVAETPPARWTGDEARVAFLGLPQAPFDTAVLEVSERVAVVPAVLDWCDVGSLLSVERLGCADERGNVLVGRAYDHDSRQTTVYTQDRLVATLGLEGLIVVDTADATLVADKARVQEVRMLVERLREAGAPEVVAPRTAARPWGTWTNLLQADGFKIKLIEVEPRQRLSLQSHRHRSEHWVVVSGTALVTRGEERVEVHPNESVYVPIGETHRLENVGKVPLKVIEVAVGEYLEEDDIIRYDDDWDRQA
ncbi:MAG: cupin domain-containing protein, partial [Coriobacteriia bacterium]|nr:cupin domain-containing protein [Coriobacteriia bacterium]